MGRPWQSAKLRQVAGFGTFYPGGPPLGTTPALGEGAPFVKGNSEREQLRVLSSTGAGLAWVRLWTLHSLVNVRTWANLLHPCDFLTEW